MTYGNTKIRGCTPFQQMLNLYIISNRYTLEGVHNRNFTPSGNDFDISFPAKRTKKFSIGASSHWKFIDNNKMFWFLRSVISKI